MFEREHHRRVATMLEALDAAELAANACYFGGGTAMALRYGEYRESVDIDFLVSSVDGYRHLRERLTAPHEQTSHGEIPQVARPKRLPARHSNLDPRDPLTSELPPLDGHQRRILKGLSWFGERFRCD